MKKFFLIQLIILIGIGGIHDSSVAEEAMICSDLRLKVSIESHWGGAPLSGEVIKFKGLLWKYPGYPQLPQMDFFLGKQLILINNENAMRFNENNFEAVHFEADGVVNEVLQRGQLSQMSVVINGKCKMNFQFNDFPLNKTGASGRYLWPSSDRPHNRYSLVFRLGLIFVTSMVLLVLLISLGKLGHLGITKLVLNLPIMIERKLAIYYLALFYSPYLSLHEKIWDDSEKDFSLTTYLKYL